MNTDAVNRLVSWFTPVAQRKDERLGQPHRLLVILGLITLPFALLYVLVSYAISFDAGVRLMLTCFVLLLTTLIAFRHYGRFRLCANLYLANCFLIAILGCSFFSGGIHSMVTPWFVLVPVASVLLLENSRDTIAWTLITSATLAGYGAAEMLGFDFPIGYDISHKDFFDTICIAGLTLILSWMAFMAGRNRDQAMATIQAQKLSIENALAEIEHLAYYDPLTQLPNRRLFMDRLGQALAENKRNGRYAALMFLDLDNFKTLNDKYGHEAGDSLLKETADRLVHCIREIDTVARFGGDEFAVILSSLGDSLDDATAHAKIVAEKILATLATPHRIDSAAMNKAAEPAEHVCTASIGVVVFQYSVVGHKDLLIQADAAMYQAKAFGKSSFAIHAADRVPSLA